MLKPVSAAELDVLHYELECAVGIVGAIHTAMVSGDFEAKEFCDPLFGAYHHLWNLVKELKTLYCDEED